MQVPHVILAICMTVLIDTISGIHYRNFLNEESLYDESNSAPTMDSMISGDTLGIASENSSLYYNSSEMRMETSANESSSQDDLTNSTFAVDDQSHFEENSTNSLPPNTHKVTTLTELLGNESQPTSSSSSESSSAGEATSTHINTMASSSIHGVNGSSPRPGENVVVVDDDDDDEPEGVARGKPLTTESVNATVLESESLYQKTLALISDTYTLSILVPIAAGIIFASTIIVIIATCKCLRRRCRRRRLHRKALPDSVKNLRPSDRARLLAESSDEEF